VRQGRRCRRRHAGGSSQLCNVDTDQETLRTALWIAEVSIRDGTLRRESARVKFDVEASIVGGFGVPYASIPLAKYRFTWPFGRIDLGPDRLALCPRGPVRFFLKPIVIRYAQIERAEIRVGRIVGAVRFRIKQKGLDRTSFATFRRSGFDRLVKVLESKGVIIAGR
jgi:hypothetical protein